MKEPLRIGLAGLGTVGASVADLLRNGREPYGLKTGRLIDLTAVSARDRSLDRGFSIDDLEWFSDPTDLARSGEIDVFVELIGGEDGPAEASVRTALQCGKSVVTANKALLAKHGIALAKIAEKAGASLFFEAAVAGGIPIVKAIRDSLAGNEFQRVYGILNGTCNYILTRMETDGITFAECVADAQRLGYAEADPTFDVEGFDAAHKLAILTCLAFGTEIDKDAIFVEGITTIQPEDIRAASDLGYRIKLLGVAQRTESGIEQRVHPTMVPMTSDIAGISGVTNAVAVDADAVGSVTMAGPGAGGSATASAVIGDIVDLARGVHVLPFGRPVEQLQPYKRAQMRAHEGGYYLRLDVPDRPGGFAAIAQAMADEDISLDSIVQANRRNGTQAAQTAGTSRSAIIITHSTTEAAVRRALARIQRDRDVLGEPQMIRIETLV